MKGMVAVDALFLMTPSNGIGCAPISVALGAPLLLLNWYHMPTSIVFKHPSSRHFRRSAGASIMTTFWHSWIAREHIFTIFRGSNNPYQGHGRAKRCVQPLLTTRKAIMYWRAQCPYRMILLSRRPLSIQVLLVSWWWFSWRWCSKILLLSGSGLRPWGSMELRLVDVVFNLCHFTTCTTGIVGSRQHGDPLVSNF